MKERMRMGSKSSHQSLSFKRYIMLGLSIVLLASLILPSVVLGQGASNTSSFGKINITNQSYFELKDLEMLEKRDGNIISFTITMHNRDSSNIQFIDYWVRLLSKDGKRFTINMIDEDREKNRVSAGSSEDFTFYANVSSSVSLQDLVFEFIKWDFTQQNYERLLGRITVPSNYSSTVPVGATKTITILDSELKTNIDNLIVSRSQESHEVSVLFKMENVGNRLVVLPDYNFNIRTKDGLVYPLTREDAPISISPRDNKRIQLHASVPSGVNNEDWQLFFTSEISSGIEMPIAFYSLGNKNNVPTEQNEEDLTVVTKQIRIDQQPVSTYINHVDYDRNTAVMSRTDIELTYVLENNGDEDIEVPNYEYFIRNSSGELFPLTHNANRMPLKANEKLELELTGSLHLYEDLNNLEFRVHQQNTSESSSSSPVAIFPVPVTYNVLTENSVDFVYDLGSYGLNIQSIYRLPLDDKDILVASLVIENRDTKNLPIPNLSGFFELDGVQFVQDQTNVVNLDQVMGIPVNGNTEMVMYTKIPYTYDFSTVDIVVNQGSEENAKTLLAIQSQTASMSLPVVNVGDKYRIDNIGKRSTLNFWDVHTYLSDDDTKLVYTEIEMVNLEKRITDLSKFIAYFRSKDGVYYPADISEVNEKIIPSGKALISFSSKVPLDFKPEDHHLVLGEQVVGVGAAEGAEEIYFRAASFNLPMETVKDYNKFEDLELYPYTISIDNVRAEYLAQGIVNFRYTLDRDRQFEFIPEGRKLTFEIEYEGMTHRTSFELGKDLKVGEKQHGEFYVPIESIELRDRITWSKRFELNIYDEFEDHRKLLSSEEFYWVVQ